MNTQSNAVPGSALGVGEVAPAASAVTRLLYWSIRRELWENRSIYIAPLAVAGLFLFGFLVSLRHLPGKMRELTGTDPMHQHHLVEQPYEFAALLLMGTYLVVAVFYCLDALYGERRDRSILFWKSLPVSDVTAVLAKATVPIVILPIVTFAITLATQWIMLLLSNVVLLGNGVSAAKLWALPWFQMSLMLFFHLVAFHGLYYAPFYGWLMLVSSWARRAPILWASLPPLVIVFVEKIAFNTAHFLGLLHSRFMGTTDAIRYPIAGDATMDPVSLMSVGKFLIDTGLWVGLIVAAAFFAAAVRLRRYQGPS